MSMNATEIRQLVEEVVRQLHEKQASATPAAKAPARATGHGGVYDTADAAIEAASEAYQQLSKLGLAGREKVVRVIKDTCFEKADEWGKLEFDETRIGKLEHKIGKLQALRNVPGTEWLSPYGMSGDHGITMEENCPFGVIGAITPVTHSIPTIACNIISMVAAGNSVVFNAHPGGAKCAAVAIREFNKRVSKEIGIDNIATMIREPSLDSFEALCSHPKVQLLCVTGGPGIVKAAMKSGKRAICAGPGNPPVLVDETADLARAARSIVIGAAFDNNLLCIGEKEIFVVDAIYDAFLREFERAGARKLSTAQMEQLTGKVFEMKGDKGGCSHPVLNRQYIGKDASWLASEVGLSVPADTPLLYAETDENHLFVIEEQMMPVIPVIRVRDVDEGIAKAKVAEHGYKHSAIMHSTNVNNLTKMARALESTLFIKNGPCLAGLGDGGEGYLSFSVATTTGEGITTPDTFTRKRRCALIDSLSII